MVRHRVSTIATGAGCGLAAAALLATLAGCSAGDVFDAIGGSVDPYAASLSSQSESSQAPASQASPAQPQAAPDAAATPAAPVQATQPAAGQDSASSSADADQGQATHTEGEAVNIEGTGAGATVYATWTRDAGGDWAAVFLTYNGTTLYAYQSGSSWTFYTADGRPVVHTSVPSTSQGYTGSGGIESYWQDASDPSVWY